jgi:hypothetical protein
VTRKKVRADEPADDAPPTGKALTRDRLKAFVVRRYSTRLHMSVILASCGLTAMASSWSLLHVGVHSMLVRYPFSLGMAYATFLFGVWVWLRATGLARSEAKPGGSSFLDGISNISTGGGKGGSWGGGSSGGSPGGGFAGRGGGFDGGGASASFAESRVPLVGASLSNDAGASTGSSSGGSSWGSGLSLDLDGDGLVLVILAAVVALAVFALSGYLIWTAPDVLTEAAFGASLTGVLARPVKQQSQSGWVMGVVRKTWWPFAIVLVLATAFAGWSQARFPQAATFKQAIHAAVES